MELKINEVALPAPITFNYEELRAELLSKVSVYETMVYTEDQVKEAKADRAALNRLKKALNDERIRQEKDYMQPFNTFKAQVGELVKIIDKSVSVVDKQVKEFEEQQKAEKLKAIEEYWHSVLAGNKVPEAVSFRQILDDNKDLSPDYRLLNGALGLAGESGEIADLVKKNFMQGHVLDLEHVAKELGDVCWYIAETATAIGIDLETVMQMNVEKLRKRYPWGFDSDRSQHREVGDI